MAEAAVTSKWQMVIPKPIRDHLNLHPGDRVDFVILGGGEVLLRPVATNVRNLKGLLHEPGREPVSLEEMEQAIPRGGGRRWAVEEIGDEA